MPLPLIAACKQGDMRKVQALTNKKFRPIDINAQDEEGCTALFYVKSRDMASMLVMAGADVNVTNAHKQTPLMFAIRDGYEDVATLLLERGARPDDADRNYRTPLHYASQYSRPVAAELLVSRDVDLFAKDTRGETALDLAIRSRSADVVKALHPRMFPFHAACLNGDTAKVSTYLEKLDKNKKDNTGSTPLHCAVKAGRATVVRFLCAKGADLNIADKLGKTPLHYAAELGHSVLVEELLQQNAHKNAIDNTGCTPLHYAATADVARLLVKGDVDLNAVSTPGNTALHCACKAGREEIALLLIESGADVTCCNNSGETPLHFASHQGLATVVKSLLAHGAKANAATQEQKRTPLHFARNLDVATALIESGATVRARDSLGCTPLHYATFNARRDIVPYLLQLGASPRAKNKEGDTPISWAKLQEHDDILQWLQEHKTVEEGAETPTPPPEENQAKAATKAATGEATEGDDSAAQAPSPVVDPEASKRHEENLARVTSFMRELSGKGGKTRFGRAKLMLVGQGRSGKTTTLGSLLGKPFQMQQHSTYGADTKDYAVSIKRKATAGATDSKRGQREDEEELSVDNLDVQNWMATNASISEVARHVCAAALSDPSLSAPVKSSPAQWRQPAQEETTREDATTPSTTSSAGDAGASTPHPDKATPTPKQRKSASRRFASAVSLAFRVTSRASSRKKRQPQQQKQQPNTAAGTSSNADQARNSLSDASATKPTKKQEPATQPEKKPVAMPSLADVEHAIEELSHNSRFESDAANITFKIFDLGGQSTFYVFHPFFLTEHAIYVVVFSMDDLLHEQDAAKKEEAWAFIEHWLTSLHLHAKGAPIFMVGTRGDVVPQRTQHEAISRELYARVRKNPAFEQLQYNNKGDLCFWPVDNTRSDKDPAIHDLRATISATAMEQEYVSQEVALPYLQLYDKLMDICKEQDKPLLTLGDVVWNARHCGLRTREETVECLRFLHRYSMVFYYDSVEGMEEFVILSPQWAVDLMARVIRNFDLHRAARDAEARKLDQSQWDDLVDRGVLHKPVLDVLWKDVRPGLFNPFLKLMMHFGLCVHYEPPRNTAHGMMPRRQSTNPQRMRQKLKETVRGKKGHGSFSVTPVQRHEQYLVPAVLPMTTSGEDDMLTKVSLSTTAAKRFNPYRGMEEKTAYVSFVPECAVNEDEFSFRVKDLAAASFLPEGLFTLVLAHVMASEQHGATQPPKLSRTHAVMFTGPTKLELQLVPQVGGIKVTVESKMVRGIMLHVVETIAEAACAHFPDLEPILLLPYSEHTLLSFDATAHVYHQGSEVWVDDKRLQPAMLERRYAPLLPVYGMQDEYDAFLSYRQQTDTPMVSRMLSLLEHNSLSVFVDYKNLEPGLEFKQVFMDAISKSAVVCPVVSAGALKRMADLQHSDDCDNVLLEWMTMLALHDHVQAAGERAHAKVRLRRVMPLFACTQDERSSRIRSRTSRMSSSTATAVDDDAGGGASVSSPLSASAPLHATSLKALREVARRLPHVVSTQTSKPLNRFFTEKLGLPAPRERTVMEVVLEMFEHDGVVRSGTEAEGLGTDPENAVRIQQAIHSVQRLEARTESKATKPKPQVKPKSIKKLEAPPAKPRPPAGSMHGRTTWEKPDGMDDFLADWLMKTKQPLSTAEALMAMDISNLNELYGMVQEDALTREELMAQGLTRPKAIVLLREAKKLEDPSQSDV